MKKCLLIIMAVFNILCTLYPDNREISTSLRVRLEGLYFNNADLRSLDSSSRTMVEYTDDRSFLMCSSLSGFIRGRILDLFSLELGGDISGFWGNDSLSYRSPEQAVYFNRLNVSIDLAALSPETVLYDMRLVLGRRAYASSEADVFPRYIWKDTVDAIQWYWRSTLGWGLDVILDFYAMNSPINDFYSIQKDRHADVIEHFDASVNTLRLGFTPFFTKKYYRDGLSSVEFRPYFLYADIGATGDDYGQGGSELSRGGMTANYDDGDYLAIGGMSLFLEGKYYATRVEAAYSWGRDNKREEIIPVSGWGLHAAFSLHSPSSHRHIFQLTAQASYFEGAEADTTGRILKYGFTGFKGDTLGGLVFRQYYGVFPGAILEYRGIDFRADQYSRRAGTYSINSGLSWKDHSRKNKKRELILDQWWYWDNNHSSLQEDGYTDLEVLQQKRWSRFMGFETDVKYRKELHYRWSWGLEGGIFLPGEYFSIALPDEGAQGVTPACMFRLYTEIRL